MNIIKHSGIIRRIDDFGRIAIPKEIRRAHSIHEGDPFEIIATDNGIYLQPYPDHIRQRDEYMHPLINILYKQCHDLDISITIEIFDQNGNTLTMPSSQQTKKAMDDCQAFMKTNADQQVQDNVIWTRFTCHTTVSHHDLSLYVCATLDKKETRVTEAAIMLRTLAAAYTSYMEQMTKHV